MEWDQREIEICVVKCVSATTCFVSRERVPRSTKGRKTAASVQEKRIKGHKTRRVGERALFLVWLGWKLEPEGGGGDVPDLSGGKSQSLLLD